MIEISIFILGAICVAIPVLMAYIKRVLAVHIEEVKKTEELFSTVVQNLNTLHNNSMNKYASIETRLAKLEHEAAASKYGKNIAGIMR